MLGEREAADSERAREYIELARPRVHVCTHETSDTVDGVRRCSRCDVVLYAPANLTEALFGAYTCKRCCSYLHDEQIHRSQYGEAPPQ